MAFPTIDLKSRQLNAADNLDHDFLRKTEYGMNLLAGVHTVDIPAASATGTVFEVARFPAGASVWNVAARMVADAPLNGVAFSFGYVATSGAEIQTRDGGNATREQGFTNTSATSDVDGFTNNDWSPMYREQYQAGIFEEGGMEASKQGVVSFSKPFSLTMTVTGANAVGSTALIAAVYFIYSV